MAQHHRRAISDLSAGMATPVRDDDDDDDNDGVDQVETENEGRAALASALGRSRSEASGHHAPSGLSTSSSSSSMSTSARARHNKLLAVSGDDAEALYDAALLDKAARLGGHGKAKATQARPSEEDVWREHSAGLTDEQLAAIESFHGWLLSDAAPLSQWVPRDRFTAIKFLRGCKFARDKAEKKYARFVQIRDGFGDCSLDRVAPFLATNAHSMPPGAVDNNGCGMMYVNVASLNKEHDFGTRNRCRSMIYLIDKVLAERRFQEAGLSLCIDFKDAPFSLNRSAQNDTHEIIAALPCRLGAGFIVDAPWFFNILLAIAAKFTSQKLIGRVSLRSRAEMRSVVPAAHLLRSLGGTLDFDPFVWLANEYAEHGRTPPLWILRRGPIPPPDEET